MYWDPFDELDRMHEEMDRLFGRFFWQPDRPLIGHSGEGKEIKPRKGRAPMYNMQETENNLIATFELPGVQKGDIDLTVEDDHLVLKVESKEEEEHKDKDNYRYAKMARSFYRSMALPREVESDKATAEYKNGVLRVEMPKKEKDISKGKRIDVK